ncbi:MAG: hypothetical protein AAFR47_02285 [Pseudomonadota bacterium]
MRQLDPWWRGPVRILQILVAGGVAGVVMYLAIMSGEYTAFLPGIIAYPLHIGGCLLGGAASWWWIMDTTNRWIDGR